MEMAEGESSPSSQGWLKNQWARVLEAIIIQKWLWIFAYEGYAAKKKLKSSPAYYLFTIFSYIQHFTPRKFYAIFSLTRTCMSH